jgi:hypothetical protein
MGYVLSALIAFASGIVLGYFYDKQKKLDKAPIEACLQKINLEKQARLDKEIIEARLQKINLDNLSEKLQAWKSELQALENNIISFKELQDENKILKTDLQNMDVECRKLKLDQNAINQKQEQISDRTNELGRRYLSENVKWIGSKLSTITLPGPKQNFLKS